MRKENEIFQLLLETAKSDERIRGMYLNGSRTNPNAEIDIFQDYDVVYVVNETKSFIEDKAWIDRFGERLFMQYPDENEDYPSDKDNSYGWLIQFADGNRIDLTVVTLECAKKDVCEDKLCKILLDKDHVLPAIPDASDESHWVKKPTQKQYLSTCNEFYWCLDNVAKGLWREELSYTLDMINFHIRPQLLRMLSWKVGVLTDFSVSIGKSGKYIHRWLSIEEYQRYLGTYSVASVNDIWDATDKMCNLFEETAIWVAEKLGYKYNQIEANNCRDYLQHVKTLPKNAKEIY